MPDIASLAAARATAGARYSDAVSDLHAALIDPAGYDAALANISMPTPPTERDIASKSCGGNANDLREGLRHPQFATLAIGDGAAGSHWDEDISLRAVEIIRPLAA